MTDQPESTEEEQVLEMSEEVAEIVESLQKERDDAIEARTRALADYQNFQRRARENEARERELGVAEVARSLIPVLDQFELALGQDAGETTTDSLMKGIEIVRDELNRALNKTGVTQITPEIGDLFDPNLHEAMLQQPAEGVEPGHVSMLVQCGWALKNQILRPAKVAIAPGDED
ncbi:MAG: nucleotide exchange factor GrpE [Phycisphaerales bacterium]|nr:nucleotide exchange factor GrpE [Phycisphaerales bacterium]